MKDVLMNRWVWLDSLTTDQLNAARDSGATFEWHLGFRNSCEQMEIKIIPKTMFCPSSKPPTTNNQNNGSTNDSE